MAEEASLRESLEAAVEEVQTPEVSAVEAAPDAATETPTEQPAAPATEEVAPATEAQDEVPTFVKDKAVDSAPASWKGAAKQVWADLPEAARAEVIRRERQVDQTLRETAQARNVVEDMQRTIAPYQERLQELGTSPAQMFSNLMEADRILSKAPMNQRAEYLAGLIKNYGIDIQALDSALAGQPVQRDQQYDIEQRVQQLLAQRLAPIEQRMQVEQQAQQEEIAMTIEQMANDPAYPYFQDVREDMADLIEIKAARGVYISLQQAYNTITGNTPQAAAQAQRTSLKQANATAQKAKSAAVSVGGSPSSVSGGADPGNLRASIESALDGARL